MEPLSHLESSSASEGGWPGEESRKGDWVTAAGSQGYMEMCCDFLESDLLEQ